MRLKNHYFLLRHGEPTWGYKEIIYPKGNEHSVSLTELGKKQIRTIARRLKREKISLIICSPYRRTRETAEIVAKFLRLPIIFDKRLIDQKLGVYAGRPKTEYYQDFSRDPRKRFKMRPKNGESWQDVQKRIKSFLKDTEKKYQKKTILIVGHGDPLWFLWGGLKGFGNKKLLELDFIKKNHIKVGELKEIK